ncbi:unnamed protein product [Absidia cylindrospora]
MARPKRSGQKLSYSRPITAMELYKPFSISKKFKTDKPKIDHSIYYDPAHPEKFKPKLLWKTRNYNRPATSVSGGETSFSTTINYHDASVDKMEQSGLV